MLLLALALAAAPVPKTSPPEPVPRDIPAPNHREPAAAAATAAPVPSDSLAPPAAPDPADTPAPPEAFVPSAAPAAPVPPDSPPVAAPGAPLAPAAPAPRPPHPLRARWAVDLPVIGLTGAIWLGSEFAAKDQRWGGCSACDPADLNALDRTVLGNQSRPAKLVSDVGLVTALAAPFVLDLGDALIQRARDRGPGRGRHLRAWGHDVAILLEVMTVDFALTNAIKFAVRRPRPYSYDPDSPVGDPTEEEARLSFFSGHASGAFAMAAAYAYLFQLRHPRSRWVAPVWVLGMSVASVTAVARVEAGKHFWTDVLVGAASGAAIGVLVPVLHREFTTPAGARLGLRVAPARTGSLLVLSGRF
jgi:membrane-associated phospholipid phosphatase